MFHVCFCGFLNWRKNRVGQTATRTLPIPGKPRTGLSSPTHKRTSVTASTDQVASVEKQYLELFFRRCSEGSCFDTLSEISRIQFQSVQRLWNGRLGFYFGHCRNFLSSAQVLCRFWLPYINNMGIIGGHFPRQKGCRSVKITNNTHIGPKLTTPGTMPPLPHTLSRHYA